MNWGLRVQISLETMVSFSRLLKECFLILSTAETDLEKGSPLWFFGKNKILEIWEERAQRRIVHDGSEKMEICIFLQVGKKTRLLGLLEKTPGAGGVHTFAFVEAIELTWAYW